MRALALTFFILVTCSVRAQQLPREGVDLQRLVDDLINAQDESVDAEALYENLALILSNPIDINQASEEQLRFLSILTEAQLHALINYRHDNGNLLSLYELQAVPTLDSISINRLLPFITLREPTASIDKSLWQRIKHEQNNYFLMRYERTLEKKRGFLVDDPTKKFNGSQDKLYYRFRTSRPGDFSFGFTLEKDAGEKFEWNAAKNIYGFDFISMHAQVINKGALQNLIIGDYQMQAGQGLVLGGLFGMGKGGETITTIRRSNIGALPYTSSNENGNLRGGMAKIKLVDNLDITAFISRTARDATLETDSTDDIISGLQTTGYHRNTMEFDKRKTIYENVYGGIITFHNRNLESGIIIAHSRFDFPIQRSSTPYNGYHFTGNTNTNTSFFLNYNWNNFSFFSEAAKTLSSGYGVVAGVLGSITTQLDISIVYRNYQRDYQSFYANAFSENTTPQNEAGIYYGLKYKWNKQIEMAGYMDIFKFPWLRFRNYAPSVGYEWLMRFNYKPSKKTLMYAQVREEKKDRNSNIENQLTYVTLPGLRRNFLINCQYEVAKNIRLKTRVQFSSYGFNSSTTIGMAMIQDVQFKLRKFSATFRYALFDTDDYDNRQYVYEDDVWLAFSIPAYYGNGVRNYIVLNYDLTKKVSVWIRFAHSAFVNQSLIGSGMDAIDGAQRNDLKFQLRIHL